MHCHYDFLVIQHPLDGVTLALRENATLLLVSPGGASLSRLLGLKRGAPALEELVRGTAVQPAPGRWEEHSFAAMLAEEDGPLGQAEVLDRGRRALKSFARASVVISYARTERDLPPLAPGDTLRCFWEVRDLLTDHHAAQLRHLAERLRHDHFDPPPLQLYLRHGQDALRLEERYQALREFAPAPLIQL